MDLKEPKAKRVGSHIKPQQPFPILIESESGIPARGGLWPLYIGSFIGDSVVIYNSEEMTALYTMGFFGKGAFSRGFPSFGLAKKGIPPVLKERQWQRRKSWMEKNIVYYLKQQKIHNLQTSNSETCNEKTEISQHKQDECDVNEAIPMDVDISNSGGDLKLVPAISDETTNTSFNSNFDNQKNNVQFDLFKSLKNKDCELTGPDVNNQVLVLADSDDEDMEKVIRDPLPHLEDEQIKTVVETLKLTLEEAFFLSFALGCLQVTDISGQALSLEQLWYTFCEVKSNFIESYVVYHYFRAKGWVVKSGYKFGGDFLLYKQGPPFYHASYVVLVEKVDSQLRRCKTSLTWTKLHGLNRLAESSGKDIIICQVVSPNNLTSEELMTPTSLSSYQVNELLMKRWISSQERTERLNV